jgi:hypothetical protein
MDNTYTLNHVALYAKNWYKRIDLVEDLKKCLDKDGYTCFTIRDIISILTNHIIKLFNHDISQLILIIWYETNERNAWKYGYYYKHWNDFRTPKDNDTLDEYDRDKALIYFYLSKLSMIKTLELGGLSKPDSKVLPINNKDNISRFWND